MTWLALAAFRIDFVLLKMSDVTNNVFINQTGQTAREVTNFNIKVDRALQRPYSLFTSVSQQLNSQTFTLSKINYKQYVGSKGALL